MRFHYTVPFWSDVLTLFIKKKTQTKNCMRAVKVEAFEPDESGRPGFVSSLDVLIKWI